MTSTSRAVAACSVAFGVTGVLALLSMPARAQDDGVVGSLTRAAFDVEWLALLPPPVALIVLGALVVYFAARRRVRELTSRTPGV